MFMYKVLNWFFAICHLHYFMGETQVLMAVSDFLNFFSWNHFSVRVFFSWGFIFKWGGGTLVLMMGLQKNHGMGGGGTIMHNHCSYNLPNHFFYQVLPPNYCQSPNLWAEGWSIAETMNPILRQWKENTRISILLSLF